VNIESSTAIKDRGLQTNSRSSRAHRRRFGGELGGGRRSDAFARVCIASIRLRITFVGLI